ncbi:trypsin-like serine peptidase [Leifsonia shinshuensis]|uniref:Trypsin-like serine protease n=1 Tax=Leifsonia shinshuensis TaxID=150026 RepID=A0A853D144_9MICO|nr:hypothetical protein [Leifsonia shinshuensis]NYJ24740.1 hypothetical protein [Leifsonia shinshuensis]
MRRHSASTHSVRGSAALAGVLRAAAVLAAAAAVAVGGLAPASAAEPAAESPQGARAYWTSEKIWAAEPDQEEPATQPPPVAALGSADQASSGSGAGVNVTVGRLFFRKPTGDAYCTAAAVNSATRNLIITAAHCVHAGGAGQRYYDDFLFAPGWKNGPSVHGYWTATAVGAPPEWTQSKKWDHDYAFVRLAADNGRQLVDRVGGNAVVGGAGHVVPDAQIWAYPGDAPYTGQVAYRCVVTTTRPFSYAPDARAGCDFNHGASGGPWLKDVLPSGQGYIWAVTSRCESAPGGGGACAGTALFAAPLPPDVYALRDAVGSR